ncbi:MAG: hypothetical protein AAF198_13595 [Pseudomonadota bacterium]
MEIKPDPNNRAGGYALLVIDGALSGDSSYLRVFNSYQTKYLGPDGWQATAHDIAVENVSVTGNSTTILVGPAVVNFVDEDTPIRVEVAGESFDAYWPETINKLPEAAIVGGIGGTGAATAVAKPTKLAKKTTQADASASDHDENATVDESENAVDDGSKDETGNKGLSLWIWIVLGVLALLIGAAAAYYFLVYLPSLAPEVVDDEPSAEPLEVETVLPALPELENSETSEPEANLCSLEALSGLAAQGFGAVQEQMATCGSEVSADLALRFIESASATSDPEALSLFGALYDADTTVEPFETEIGVTLSNIPAIAAEYYARAVEAGSQDAVGRLANICSRLSQSQMTLDRTAFSDYCGGN